MSAASPALTPLLDELLEDQATLKTPVAEFSDWHDSEPELAEHYKRLVPLSKPGSGEQYAFEVNLDQCTGCKACVAACHSQNGLDDDESWRDVGTLLEAGASTPYMQTVTAACHHCEEPACAHGCPVLAYEKDATTGIVRHLDDQCIGCSYCVMKCPYDVPKYNAAKGIVRKCDMCHDRLAAGEAPACVQACPNEAISIRIVKTNAPRDPRILPTAFPSSYTLPTTRYVSKRPVPADAKPESASQPRLDYSHAPLSWMLVLTQMGAGGFLFGALVSLPPLAKVALSIIAATATLAGMGLSVFHLGQPLKAWRAFLGWRRSWLSREIIAFGLFAKFAVLPPVVWLLTKSEAWLTVSMGLAALVGLLAVSCSVMVYVDTQRPFWSLARVGSVFLATILALGAGLAASLGAEVATMGLLACMGVLGGHFVSLRDSTLRESTRILQGPLRNQVTIRRILLVAAAICFALAVLSPFFAVLALACGFAAFIIERHHFFTAAAGASQTGR